MSYISQEQSAKSNRAVVVASENGVLAAINPSSGKLRESDAHNLSIFLQPSNYCLNVNIVDFVLFFY